MVRLYEFQSTRLREARLKNQSREYYETSFNPRACVRRDLERLSPTHRASCFNPRACVRRDLSTPIKPTMPPSFNPRACVRRDGWKAG